jgi:trigger factor
MRQQQQAIQARDRALETLLDQVDIPLPDSIVEEEAHRLEHSMHDQIERAGADWGTYLQMVGKSEEEFSADLHDQARRSVKIGLGLDQVAKQEDLGVNDAELSYFVTQQAEQMGVDPQLLARQIAEGGQIGAAAAEVLRGKAMALLASRVQIKDEAGHELDYNTLLGIDDEGGEDASEAEAAGEEAEEAGAQADAADAALAGDADEDADEDEDAEQDADADADEDADGGQDAQA